MDEFSRFRCEIVVAAFVLGPEKIQIIFILSLLTGIAGSRIIRGAVMGVREKNDYVKRQ